MRSKLFVCASSSALDVRRNSISIFHVLEEVRAPAYPVVISGISVVALLELDETEPINPEIQLRVFLGEQQLFAGPFQANFQVRRMARALADFNAFMVPAPGTLRVVLHSAGQDIVSWNILCEQIAPPQLELHLQSPEQPQAEQAPHQ
jgi:hypothetical protein